MIKTFFNY